MALPSAANVCCKNVTHNLFFFLNQTISYYTVQREFAVSVSLVTRQSREGGGINYVVESHNFIVTLRSSVCHTCTHIAQC